MAAETLLGAFVFSRHSDRTPKSSPPALLTPLGYSQMFNSGNLFRTRYLDSTSPSRILSIDTPLVKNSQLHISAPNDLILMTSAQAFAQGLYPPVGPSLSTQTLRNGTTVSPPLDGYQLIPVHTLTQGAGSEDQPWLQAAQGCAQASLSSNAYYHSREFEEVQGQTRDVYGSVAKLVEGTFKREEVGYRNAYASTLSPSFLQPCSLLRLSFPVHVLLYCSLTRC
jgi:hypothetical protein